MGVSHGRESLQEVGPALRSESSEDAYNREYTDNSLAEYGRLPVGVCLAESVETNSLRSMSKPGTLERRRRRRTGHGDQKGGIMGNPVVHFEVNGPQGAEVAKFYSELFGWHTQTIPEMSYATVDTHAGEGINGGFGQTGEDQRPYVTFYVEADDLQGMLDKAESLGGKTVVPVTDVPNVVTYAQFADPEGNVIGIVAPSDPQGQGGVSEGDNPGVGWFEVLGANPKKLWDFYTELFGWKVKDVSGAGFTYGEVDAQSDKGIRGGIGSSPMDMPQVNLYAGVDDLQKYVERAESLGGQIVMPPTKAGETTEIAMFRDPQGTSFGLFRSTR